MVKRRTCAPGTNHPQQHPQQCRKGQRGAHEQQGCREPAQYDLEHRLLVAERVAEVAAQHLKDVAQQLLIEGAVEAVERAHLRVILLGSALPCQDVYRVARRDVDQHKRDDQHPQYQRYCLKQTPGDICLKTHLLFSDAKTFSIKGPTE
jgi:hypothetical protein